MRGRLALTLLLLISAPFAALAQTSSQSTNSNTPTVPRLIRFSGTFTGVPEKSVVGVTFSLYREQTGGSPLWLETQNVPVDTTGHYSILLGAASNDGLPSDLFMSNEARWLGVKAEGQEEQARVLLVSVPYALKAGDAETLGGKPASAFLLNESVNPPATPSNIIPAAAKASLALAAANMPAASPQPATQFADNNVSAVVQVTQSGNGYGVQASSILGPAVFGQSSSTAGATVYGQSTATTGGTVGVRGDTASNAGIGLYGISSATSGHTYGVRGDNASTGGVGLIGFATASTGSTIGLEGTASSTSGQALVGYETASTGSTKAVYGQVSSPNGIAGVFNNIGGGKVLSIQNDYAEKLSVDGSGNVIAAGMLTSNSGGFKFPDGTVQTTAGGVTIGSGIASVTATLGSGVTAATAGGAVTLGTDTTVLQTRVTGACTGNQFIQSINANGTVNCVTPTTSSLPTGFTVFGSSPTLTLPGYTYANAYAEINGQAWDSSLAPMTQNVNAFAYAQFGGNVYVFGLPDSITGNPTVVQEFNPSGTTGTWTTLTAAPMPNNGRSGATAVAFGNYIYVFGGFDPVTFNPVQKCDYFDTATGLWNDNPVIGLTGCANIPLTALPTGATGLAGTSGVAVPAGTNAGIYLFGGVTNATTGALSTAVLYYNPTTNTYPTTPTLPTLPAGLDYSVAVYTHNLIYVMGGATSTQAGGTNQNLAFDPTNPSAGFSHKANLPDIRAYHTAAVSPSGQVYIAGDISAADVTFPLYDPPSDSFVQFPQMLRGRNAPGSAVLSDGRFILFGGTQSTANPVDVFHPNLVLYEYQATP
jgi:Kelch motif